MKKVAIGCGLVVLLLGIGAAVASYWVYSRVTSAVSELADLAEAARLDQKVANRRAFTPPAGGELTADMVARLMKVQDDIRAALGPRFDEFEARYKEFAETLDRKQGQPTTPGEIVTILSAYKDMGGILLAAKRAQVDALNRAGFSLGEYAWVRNTVYAAVGVPGAAFNLSEIADAITNDRQPTEVPFDPTAGLKAPEGNRVLVAPHKDKLMETYPLVIFGL